MEKLYYILTKINIFVYYRKKYLYFEYFINSYRIFLCIINISNLKFIFYHVFYAK